VAVLSWRLSNTLTTDFCIAGPSSWQVGNGPSSGAKKKPSYPVAGERRLLFFENKATLVPELHRRISLKMQKIFAQYVICDSRKECHHRTCWKSDWIAVIRFC
jgi:hypothetical protein